MTILVITTGGTIGAEPYEDIKYPARIKLMPPQGVDPVRDVLGRELSVYSTRCVAFEHRDSNYIDEPYRAKLLQLIEREPEKAVLITHGTDTLLQMAEYIFHRQSSPGLKDKVVFLTGAMVPLACGSISDGYMNLGFALEQLAHGNRKPGIYIVLCDYLVPEKQEVWAPHLYHFEPGRYDKYHDPDDASRSRIRAVG